MPSRILLFYGQTTDPNAKSGTGETEEYIDAAGKRSVRTRQGPLLKDTVIGKRPCVMSYT